MESPLQLKRLITLFPSILLLPTVFLGCGGAQTAGDSSALLDTAGSLSPGDTDTGRAYIDTYSVRVPPGQTIVAELLSSDFDPILAVQQPGQGSLVNDDWQGDRSRSRVEFVPQNNGEVQIVVTNYGQRATGAYRLSVRAAGEGTLEPGSARSGALAEGDTVLRDGSWVDRYELPPAGAGSVLSVRPTSGARLRVLVTDAEGQTITGNSAGQFAVRPGVSHRVMVFGLAPNQGGTYDVAYQNAGASSGGRQGVPVQNVSQTHHVVASGGSNGSAAAQRVQPPASIDGSLAQGDGTLSSGEFTDTYTVDAPASSILQVELNSSAFDAYLLARGNGQNLDNDDARGGTNSLLEINTGAGGQITIIATSYRPGMTGAYQIKFTVRPEGTGTQPTDPPPSGNTVTPTYTVQRDAPNPGAVTLPVNDGGSLAQGDSTMPTGHFVDQRTIRLPTNTPIRIGVSSSEFDTRIAVRTPSGRELANDDIAPQDTNSRVDIPMAEPGDYQITVTSFRPQTGGNYALKIEAGDSFPGVAGGGRVFGLFVGISDYPGNISDLPECANDARKMFEAMTQSGLMQPADGIVLTDGQATRDAVRAAMQRFAREVTPRDNFVLFYSGHGNRGAAGSSQDVREIDTADETIVLIDGELVDDEMGRMFDAMSPRLAILGLDSCFAGGFAKDVITRAGRVGLFSSEEDVTSSVAQQFQAGGYLSHFMQTAIAGEADADPRDRVLSVGELTHFVWRQFGSHAADVRMGSAYQHLVVDRGAVGSESVLWGYH